MTKLRKLKLLIHIYILHCLKRAIDKAKLKTELETLTKILRLKLDFRNEENEFGLGQFKRKLLAIQGINLHPLKYT